MYFPLPKLAPAVRGQLCLAAIPLAVLVITRALGEVEDLIAARITELAALDAGIAARRAQLATTITTPTPGDAPEPEAPTGGLVDHWGSIPEGTSPCWECDDPATMISGSGLFCCAAHDPTVRLG